MHVVVRAEGWHALESAADRKMRFLVRLHAFAGLPQIRIEHTLIMTEGYDEAFLEVSMGFHLWPSALRKLTTAYVSSEHGNPRRLIEAEVAARETSALTQVDWEAFRAGTYSPSSGTWGKLPSGAGGRNGEGWVRLADARGSLCVGGQDWRESQRPPPEAEA